MQTKSFIKKKKDSEDESDDYELPPDHYYDSRFAGKLNHPR
jgi:hypothetical protein